MNTPLPSNGADWLVRNCGQCKKREGTDGLPGCVIAQLFSVANAFAGKVWVRHLDAVGWDGEKLNRKCKMKEVV